MAGKKRTDTEGPETVRDSFSRLAKRLDESRTARDGEIVFRLSGKGGGDYRVGRRAGRMTVAELAAGEAPATLIEVSGDAAVVRAILEGKKDAVKQFAAGGVRIRGDLSYFSDLALELGIIDAPL
jgi:hypothetical protein